MVKLLIQFPNYKGSKIWDGTKHEAEVNDVVKVGKSNVYILDYYDKTLCKRSRILLQKGKIQITHLPIEKKEGLNAYYDECKKTSPQIDVEEFFRTDKELGICKPYPDLDTVKRLVEPPKKDAQYTEFNFGFNDEVVLGPRAINIPDSYADKVYGEYAAAEAMPEDPKPEVSEDKGILGFWGMTPSAVGPGENGSYKRPFIPTISLDAGGISTNRSAEPQEPPFGPPPGPPPEDGPHGPRR